MEVPAHPFPSHFAHKPTLLCVRPATCTAHPSIVLATSAAERTAKHLIDGWSVTWLYASAMSAPQQSANSFRLCPSSHLLSCICCIDYIDLGHFTQVSGRSHTRHGYYCVLSHRHRDDAVLRLWNLIIRGLWLFTYGRIASSGWVLSVASFKAPTV